MLFKVNPKHFWLKDDGKFPQVGKKFPQKEWKMVVLVSFSFESFAHKF
jgi:hypothetical protein